MLQPMNMMMQLNRSTAN